MGQHVLIVESEQTIGSLLVYFAAIKAPPPDCSMILPTQWRL